MSWLKNPKVRLGLAVNGLYLISLFTHSPAARPSAYGPTHPPHATTQRRPPIHARLTPPSAPSQATTYYAKESDQLNVYLTNDLTLVSSPGHRLLLSPTFTVGARDPEPPRSVLLRFVSFSGQQRFDDASPLTIIADGDVKWPAGWFRGHSGTYGDARARHSLTEAGGGQVVETLGEELPYEDFIEIISARQVIISLGPDMVELTAPQVEALRDMHRRLQQQQQSPVTKARY